MNASDGESTLQTAVLEYSYTFGQLFMKRLCPRTFIIIIIIDLSLLLVTYMCVYDTFVLAQSINVLSHSPQRSSQGAYLQTILH